MAKEKLQCWASLATSGISLACTLLASIMSEHWADSSCDASTTFKICSSRTIGGCNMELSWYDPNQPWARASLTKKIAAWFDPRVVLLFPEDGWRRDYRLVLCPEIPSDGRRQVVMSLDRRSNPNLDSEYCGCRAVQPTLETRRLL
jgi:hypothetical protein